MGQLMKFVRRVGPAKTVTIPGGNAQILFFTGVRYERGTTPPQPKRLASPRRRKRG